MLQLGRRTITNCNEKCMDAGITDESILTLEIKPAKAEASAEDDKVTLEADEKEVERNTNNLKIRDLRINSVTKCHVRHVYRLSCSCSCCHQN